MEFQNMNMNMNVHGSGEMSNKILYIVVIDDVGGDKKNIDKDKDKGKESFCYTRSVLQSTLQIMGCKARHAFKVYINFFLF